MARVPLYKAAETEMIRRIRAGEWKPGLRLPNEFGLADEFGVSQGTMRRALMSLEGMGLLDRKPGRGTIVADPGADDPPRAPSPATATLVDEQGRPARLEVFRPRSAPRQATPAEADLFGCAQMHGLDRMFRLDGVRVGLDSVAVPLNLGSALPENAPADLYEICATIGLPVARIDDHLTAEVTSMGESVALAVDRHTGLLVRTRTAFGADGAPVARQVTRLVTGRIGYAVTGAACE